MRVLYVRPYTHRDTGRAATASDSLGFNVTCADALEAGLTGRGVEVTSVTGGGEGRTAWVGEVLTAFERQLTMGPPDAVLAFHAFWPFTVELRRVMDDAGFGGPLVTYTHGSHWDPTDLFRFERYPRLAWADLGNLMCADRVLVVSEWMAATIAAEVRAAAPSAAAELVPRLRRVGLPLDLPRIDAARRPEAPGAPVVVFNHAPVAAKRPEVFLELAAELMRRTPARVLVTRRFPPASALERLDPARVRLGGDLPIDDYYAALWGAHLQVSTATHESLGVATLEAMATGTCCLLPRVGAYPEITDPDALYGDTGELLSRLVELVGHPEPRRDLAARQMARTRAAYSPERVAAAVHEVLLEVAR